MRIFLALWLLASALAWAQLEPAHVRAFSPSKPREASAAQPAAPPQKQASQKQASSPQALLPKRTPADRVVVVSIDGLRPDAIMPSMTSLHRLFLQGSSPKVARTIDKSATLPSHASMVSGVDASEHGLNFNSFKPDHANILRPTMFSVAHAAGLPTFMFVGKAKLKHLLNKPTDAELKVAGINCKRVVKEASEQLKTGERGLVFMHFADPDSAGHRHGWMSDEYVAAAHNADACLESVMDIIEHGGKMDRTLLLVTSDHGGHNRSHGTRMEVDQRIPWYAWGAGARRGRVQRNVHTTDTAATALAALGLSLPANVMGKAITEALGEAAGPAGMPIVGAPVVDAI